MLQSSHFLRIGSSLRQLLFGTAIFFSEELFKIMLYKKELLFQSRCFCTASTFSEKLRFGRNRFFRKSISALPTFSGELSSQRNYFFKICYLLQQLSFRKSYFFTTDFFRRVTISQLRFFPKFFLVYLLLLRVASQMAKQMFSQELLFQKMLFYRTANFRSQLNFLFIVY